MNNLCRIASGVLLALLMKAGAARAADTWPQFRGPTGQGTSDATGLPVDWSATKNVTWHVEVPGRGWSSPVLLNGKIYLTSAESENGPVTLHALCFDAENGRLIWDTQVFAPPADAVKQMHPKNSPASATPIVTTDRLYVHFGHLGTAALDLSGKIIWQTTLSYAPVHGNGGSPALVGDKLVFSCDGARDPFIVALEASTGQVKWKTPRNTPAQRKFSFSTPLAIDVDHSPQIILPGSGMVGGYDPQDGHEVWRVLYGEGYSVVPRPIFADGLLFVSSGFDSPIVYAIDPKNAAGDITKSHVAWTKIKGAPLTPSMLCRDDALFFVSDIGVVTCADALSGNVHWTHRLDGNFSASPVLAEGRIYLQSEQGHGYVITAGKTFEQLADNDLGERSFASPAFADGAIWLRTEKHLWKIAAAK